MRRFHPYTVTAAIALAAALVSLTPSRAHAQGNLVAGTVVSQGDRPLSGVEIQVTGPGGRITTTDNVGRFRITGLTGPTVVLDIRHIGYRSRLDTVPVGATDLRIVLAEVAVNLNEVVVTGTAGSAQKREVGTSIVTVNASDITAKTAIPTVQGLLNGRVPGLDVIGSSGQVGAGAQMRIRGIGTFSLSSSPLIYIDGIRVDNGQTGLVSRINDLDPNQIASVEVLEGPAAATIYGTEAARGVINIITKRGDAGPTRYTFGVRSGTQWFRDAAGRWPTNYWIDPQNDSVWSINFVKSEAAHGTPLFRNGQISNYSGMVSGGTSQYRYFVSGDWDGADGIVEDNSRIAKNVRANLSILPSEKVSIEASTGYITSTTHLAHEGGSPGAMWGVFALPQRTAAACPILQNPVRRGCGWSRGSIVGPPEVYAATQNWQGVRRFTGSAQLKYNPFTWMANQLTVGTDYTLEDINTYLPYQTDSVIVFFLGSRFDGSRAETTQQTTYNTYDYSGSVHFNVKPNLGSKTSIGVQYYTNLQTALSASGTHFPSPGLSTVSATGLKAQPTSSLVQNNTLGAYGQQEFALNDRLFVVGAVRVDNNSAFGSQAHLTTYPKLSLSWVASEEPSVRSILPSFVNELRLRGAYGGSGQQPLTNSALQTLAPVSGPNGTTVLTNSTIGNKDLKPERVLGAELGFEAGLLNDRAGIDLTVFRDVSTDAILATTVAPSTGFGASTQYVNAGQINKRGLELALTGHLINGRRFGWDTQLNFAQTKSKIVRMGAGADTLINVTGGNSAIGTYGDIFHRIGYAPFDLFSYRVVSATFDATTGKAINPICDNGHGGTIPCYVPGTATIQAPLVYFGHSIPTTTGSWSNDFRYGDFGLHVMVDFQAGFRKTDTNFEQSCQVFLSCREDAYPSRYDPAIVAQTQNGGPLQGYFIRDASFAKLREVTLSYDANQRVASLVGAQGLQLTLTGRELGLWTNYTGLDPEASVVAPGGSSVNFGTDQAEFPALASIVLGVRLTY